MVNSLVISKISLYTYLFKIKVSFDLHLVIVLLIFEDGSNLVPIFNLEVPVSTHHILFGTPVLMAE